MVVDVVVVVSVVVGFAMYFLSLLVAVVVIALSCFAPMLTLKFNFADTQIAWGKSKTRF